LLLKEKNIRDINFSVFVGAIGELVNVEVKSRKCLPLPINKLGTVVYQTVDGNHNVSSQMLFPLEISLIHDEPKRARVSKTKLNED
jgi:hypothetical protein